MVLRVARSVCLIGLLAALAGVSAASTDATTRRFRVRDSIEMAHFAEAGLVSPDGRYIATVTERGRLDQNVIEATVWLFESSAVRSAIRQPRGAAVQPSVLARMTAPHGAIVTRLMWESGSGSLLFLGREGRENRQLFRVALRDRNIAALSLATQDVVDYSAVGNHIAYLAGPDVSLEKAWWANDPSSPDIVGGVRRSLWEILFPNYRNNTRYMPTQFEVWRTGAAATPVIDAVTNRPMQLLASYNLGAMGLSHDGTMLILVAHVDRIPKLWETYEVPEDLDNWAYKATPGGAAVALSERENDYAWPLQYQLIDLEHGTRSALLESPAADFQRAIVDQLQVVWSADDRLVALTGTFLPLATEAPSSKRPCGVAVVRIADAHPDCLIDHANPKADPVTAESWDEAARLRVQSGGLKIFQYSEHSRRWTLASRPTRSSAALELAIQQDLNSPPVLTARTTQDAKGRPFFDPNPQLKAISLGNVSVYNWKSAGGLSASGGLAKPPDFVPGHRYPLVIQTHGFPRDQFFRVGYGSETANAGRALAARGMLVLQVQEPHGADDGTWQEATERGTEVYLAAIDQLTAEGLVDSTKVGITGYSRAGAFVVKAITQAPDRFAAAAVVNTDVGSQFGYYTYIDYGFPTNSRRNADFFGGSLPYGSGLKDWFDRAPGFNTDKIRAPVLVSAADPQHLLVLWNLYAPLIDQHKAVELQYFRNGEHNLSRPPEVLAHQEMLVDWFDFWLNSQEDSDPAKADQYVRWRALRDAARPGS